jgi:hypothetical protein
MNPPRPPDNGILGRSRPARTRGPAQPNRPQAAPGGGQEAAKVAKVAKIAKIATFSVPPLPPPVWQCVRIMPVAGIRPGPSDANGLVPPGPAGRWITMPEIRGSPPRRAGL